ncbi:MAG: VOC family protein [Pseudomonadota bacterium]
MEKATGIGGFFFRASDGEKLLRWYAEHLGVDMSGGAWMQQAGPTVVAPFERDADYFPTDRQWMINFRVDSLDKMIAQLQAAGVDVTTNEEWNSEVGRFARIHDPEGNPIELWEMAADLV